MTETPQTNKTFRVRLVDGNEFLLSNVEDFAQKGEMLCFYRQQEVVAVVPVASLAMLAETSVYANKAVDAARKP